MKNHLNVVLFSLIAATGAVLLSGCGTTTTASGSGSDAKKIGVVLIGDETEGYSKAHIDGINEAAKELNISDRLIYKYKIQEDDGCKTAIDDLISEDCGLIISNSYGHQDYMAPAAKANPDVTFISMTGDYAAVSKISNFKNAFVSIYEARYVSGIVAGMLAEFFIRYRLLLSDAFRTKLKAFHIRIARGFPRCFKSHQSEAKVSAAANETEKKGEPHE